MTSVNRNLEGLMSVVGKRGRYQIIMHLLLTYTYVVLVFNHVLMSFHGASIPHTCQVTEMTEEATLSINGTNNSEIHYTIYGGKEVVNVTNSQCSSTLSFSDGETETVSCSEGQWRYSPKYGEKNVVSQFDLVCSDKYLASLATTIYFAGVMVGGIIFGDLADRFGRLPILLLTLYASAAVGLVAAFSVNYTMFIALRFVIGFLMQGIQTSGYTLIMELFKTKYRPFAAGVTECGFGFGIMSLAGLAYVLREWWQLQIAVALASALPIFYICVVPESLRWLIVKRKTDKADRLIRRICRMNKIPYPAEIWHPLKAEAERQETKLKQFNLTYLFRSVHLRKRSFILFYLWVAISASYYGLTFKMIGFSGNRYLTFFIGGAVETVSYVLTLIAMQILGRKKPLFFCFVFAAIMCVSAGIVSDSTSDMSNVIKGLALAGRCATAAQFCIIFVYTSELYPTVVRNIGMGACCFWARFGGVLAPQINQWTKTLGGFDAIIVFGVMTGLGAILLFPLPETHNKRLPDTLAEIESGMDDSGSGDNGLEMSEEEMLKT